MCFGLEFNQPLRQRPNDLQIFSLSMFRMKLIEMEFHGLDKGLTLIR